MTYKGRVQGNVIVLEETIPLPNGEPVLVTVEQVRQGKTITVTPEELQQRQDLVARIKEFGQRLEKRNLNLGDLILEEKEELANRA
jgi:hypothetical protein